jgi:histidyl-tRNA synthetase
MRDLPPEDYAYLQKVRAAFEDLAEIYGFSLMEPSPIELLETLEAKSGPAIRNEIFLFKDRGDRDVGLRFDLTVGLTRYILSHRELRLPVKVGAFSQMWRYDEPQHGRYRSFYQWDTEVFGSADVEADAEVIEFTGHLFDKLGLTDKVIEVGDRQVVEQFIRKNLHVEENSLVNDLLRAVDKVERRGSEVVFKDALQGKITEEQLRQLLDHVSMNEPSEKTLARISETSEQSRLPEVMDALKSRNVSGVQLNLGIVRGLDYYSGIVFEVKDKGSPDLGALAGGGRYDALTRAFGRADIAATGAAGGVERTLIALQRRKLGPKLLRPIHVLYATPNARRQSHALAGLLRQAGLHAEAELAERSLSNQLKVAAASNAAFAVIVGEKELATGKVTLRDMTTGKQETIPQSELVSTLSQRSS